MPTPEELMTLRASGGMPGGAPAGGPPMGRAMGNPWVQQLYAMAQRARAARQARMQQFQASPMGQRLAGAMPGGMGGVPGGGPMGFAMGEPTPGGPMPARTAAQSQAQASLQPQQPGEGEPGEQEPDNDPDDRGSGKTAAPKPPARNFAPNPARQAQSMPMPQAPNRMPSFGAGASGGIQDEIRKRRAAGTMY